MITFTYKNFLVMIERGHETVSVKASHLDTNDYIKKHYSGFSLPQIKRMIKEEISSKH